MTQREEILSSLNDAQRAAVLYDGGPLLILAGAGSGKTKTATARVARLILDGTPPDEICVLTFTNKAAQEIRDRIAGVCGPAAHRVTAGTFHALAARLIRERPGLVGLRDRFTIADEDDSRAIFRSLIPRSPDDRDDIKNAYTLLMGARERGITPAAYAKMRKALDTPEFLLADRYMLPYVRKLLDSNTVDFPGLLLGLLALCEHDPAHYQRRWRHIIVDEYQDTNAVQDRIVTICAHEHENICAVGDEQQSIYSFRGAQVDNILSFPQRWRGAEVIKLEANYRSRPEILRPANAVLAHAEGGYGKTLRAARDAGGQVIAWVADDEYDEARRIARKCLDLHGKGRTYSSQAVIYRTNAQSRVLEQEFNRAGVPYRIVGGVSFWERAEVKDCLAYLRLIHNRADDVAFRRVCNVPRRGLGDAALKLIEQAQADGDVPQEPEQDPVSLLAQIFAEAPDGQKDAAVDAAIAASGFSLFPKQPEICGAPHGHLRCERSKGHDPLDEHAAQDRADIVRWRSVPDPEYGAISGPEDMPPGPDDPAFDYPEHKPSMSLWDASERAPLKGKAKSGLKAFKAAVEQAAQGSAIPGRQGELDLVHALTSLLSAVDYTAHLATDKESADDRQANVDQLVDLCGGYTDLSAFLEYTALSAEAAQDTGGDRVTLCTMHGSKGLEWDVVFAPGWEQNIFPSPRAVAEGQMAEERRLAYVCITRARDLLFIGGARRRRGAVGRPGAFLREAQIQIRGWLDDEQEE